MESPVQSFLPPDEWFWQAEENPQIATYEDHRMAMAFAPLALVRPAGIEIMHPEVVSKSYPHYWEHLTEAGFLIEEKTE